MPLPESNQTPLPLAETSSGEVGPSASAESETDLTEVARTLAAHGGGAASFDLALDLVLNEVVEQARLSTGATGAAIALAREGEMECRATTGVDAPHLGSRLETTSGLSGACLQTGKMQQCGDTETDPRVNAEACRSLGVRSILILPLADGKEPFGILEVFSPRPNAFGDRDINTLLALARRVVENKKRAEDVSAAVPSGIPQGLDEPSDLPSEEPTATGGTAIPDLDRLLQPDAMSLVEDEETPRRTDVWTSILSVLVILTAVLLGLAVGWRAGMGQVLRGTGPQQGRASSTTNAEHTTNLTAPEKTAPVGGATGAGANSLQPAKAASVATPAALPDGGLQVTQNGKVIYRLPPTGEDATGAKRATPEGAEDNSTKRLIHRVEPVYPPEARAQQIQGAVTLDVQIGGEGTVHNIDVVEGNPVLADAAVQAVRQWRYRPYSVDGRPVEMQTRVTIRFTLPPT
jgi:TonB family protein